jgi:hypothetical protein
VGFAGNIILAAMRNTSPDEELTTDYALFGDDDSEMQCQRGTASCRGTIGGRYWQRPELQRKYGNYFSTYLLHRLNPQSGGR